MTNNTSQKILIALLLSSPVWLMAIAIAVEHTATIHLRNEAIQAGAAYYKCDETTGECVFTWREELWPMRPEESK